MLATVNQALINGASIIFITGGIYEQQIDLSKATVPNICISSYNIASRPIFTDPLCLITDTEAAVDGYTKVYSSVTDKTFAAEVSWIFHDGINDVPTLISDAERHPLERGYEYRCSDTKIARCSATTLAAALTEIENGSIYKWFFDTATGIIYFSRPSAITSTNPLKTGFGNSLFINGGRRNTVSAIGIESKHMAFNIGPTTAYLMVEEKSKLHHEFCDWREVP